MNLNGKKVLVTGGAGFIGSHVVELLLEKKAHVTVVDNLSSGNKENLKKVYQEIVFNETDIKDTNAVKEIVKKNEVVFHFAANADVPRSVQDPEFDFQNNVMGTYNLLTAAVGANVEKFIFASSAAVYGNPRYTPIDEKHPTNPISPYGASKLSGEALGRSYHTTYGLPFVAMRIFNTYGARQPRYVMYDLLKKLYRDPQRLEVLGTGEEYRDYCYVTDTAQAFVLAAEKAEAGTIYNIAGGNTIQIKQVVELLLETLHLKGVDIHYTQKSWKGDINKLSADISKIRQDLGFEPSISIGEGIVKLHQYLEKSNTL